jgi:hypothetical protein
MVQSPKMYFAITSGKAKGIDVLCSGYVSEI